MTFSADRAGTVARRGGALALLGLLAACAGGPAPPTSGGTMAPYRVNGVLYKPRAGRGYDQVGVATWYGAQYHHRATADGEMFDMDKPSAAHPTLPLPCIVEVTDLENGRRIRVRVNDRGPFVRGRILDLSKEGAKELGFLGQGSARVRVRYVGPAPAWGGGSSHLEPVKSLPRLVQSPAGRSSVQAAAFADRANAQTAATALGGLGAVRLEPITRGSQTLWRVIVQGSPDQRPSSLVSALAASGYPGAKVLTAE